MMKDVKMQRENVSAKEILHDERCENAKGKCFCKRDIAKSKKVEQHIRYAEKRKNDNEIRCTSKRKTYDVAQSCKSSQIEKSQDTSTHDNTQINNNKCLHK